MLSDYYWLDLTLFFPFSQFSTTLCNSSFKSNYSVCIFTETLDWYFICKGEYGQHVTFYFSAKIYCGNKCMAPLGVFPWKHPTQPGVSIEHQYTGAALLHSEHCILLLSFLSVTSGLVFVCFLVGLGWTFRPIIQSCKGIEHYLAVIHQVTFPRYKSIYYGTGSARATACCIGQQL